MTRTSIEWADETWNPIAAYDRETGKRGWFCTKVSPGCTNCYAEQFNRFRGNGHLYRVGNLAKVRFELAPTLTAPLRWRKPRRVFVNSMTDLFLEAHPEEMIDQVFAIMALAPHHQFLVLTKRPERMRAYFADNQFQDRVDAFATEMAFERTDPHDRRTDDLRAIAQDEWPLPNVWLGTSVENQKQADIRIPDLLQTPAAVRFLSCEPLLDAVDLPRLRGEGNATWRDALGGRLHTGPAVLLDQGHVDWVIVGGESGAGARPCHLQWMRDLVTDCQNESVPVFVKQVGAQAIDWEEDGIVSLDLRDAKGGDPHEWPIELRVRQFPKEAVCQPQ